MAVDGLEWAIDPYQMFSDHWTFWGDLLGNGKAKLARSGQLTLAESVRLAEAIANENGGTLPSGHWLKWKQFHSLVKNIKTHSEAFSHIPRKCNFTKVDKFVEFANHIATQNNGVLPSMKSLIDEGHEHLVRTIYNHPDAFCHLDQEFYSTTGCFIGLRIAGTREMRHEVA